MNRLEMFVELKKDNTKVFECVEHGVKYYVENGKIRFKNSIRDCLVKNIDFDDDCEYVELKKPLWETIKNGEKYYSVVLLPVTRDSICFSYYGKIEKADNYYKETHNMFRTEAQAQEKANKILKVLEE